MEYLDHGYKEEIKVKGPSRQRTEEDCSKHIPDLPPEIVWKVLAKLPVLSLMRCREVCKQWKSTIEAPPLALLCESSKPVLLYHHPGHNPPGDQFNLQWKEVARFNKWHLKFHNTVTNEWEEAPIPFTVKDNVEADTLVAADGGLLCFSSRRAPDCFVVYNPLSEQLRGIRLPIDLLPTLPKGAIYETPFEYILFGMVVDRQSGNYQVVVSGIRQDVPQPTLIYDSELGLWKVCPGLPKLKNYLEESGVKLKKGEWRCRKRGVQCADNLYWFIHYERHRSPKVNGALLRFNVLLETWDVLQESGLSDYSPEFHMVGYMGEVILCDWTDEDCHEAMGNLEIEDLGAEIRLMDEDLVDLYHNLEPESYWKEFFPFRCLVEGDNFYIVHRHQMAYDISSRVLVYKPNEMDDDKRFTWLPEWQDLSDENQLWTFTPTLRADHTDELYFQFSCGDLISFLYVYVDRLIKEWELHLLNLRRVRIMHSGRLKINEMDRSVVFSLPEEYVVHQVTDSSLNNQSAVRGS
ncbi:hypothetical protein AXG93_3271s1260 [Marchantia polymorpha subsp. ruderalis]|uniref:F-box domain-containing protein n=1 Tax=Marchantia polymorpha subsp. ruderalis TaxID=1480154 RepID=A0A176VP62_MARPO|nr:hypothetical protein AXG93_3271s1260 [Marchantia polymorpha subsp. ruderalis]